jgi:hypothetical protein
MFLEAAFWIGWGLSASGTSRWCRPWCPPALGAFAADCAVFPAVDFFIGLIDVEVTADLERDGGMKGMAWVLVSAPEADPGIFGRWRNRF